MLHIQCSPLLQIHKSCSIYMGVIHKLNQAGNFKSLDRIFVKGYDNEKCHILNNSSAISSLSNYPQFI